jgi:mannosyl-3-phosphoglycerate phosphatase family protein
MKPVIIITDLDGTLLHAHTYSFLEAGPALEMIRKMKIPLILCSSKTRAEIEVYRKKLINSHPFITENGGGIFIPVDYFSFPVAAAEYGKYKLISLGTSYAEIRKKFTDLREKLGVRVQGFGDMDAGEVAELTNLSPDEARLACRRDFDEPFIFTDKKNLRFLQAIERIGLRWTEGRLFHIMGNHDKGRAVDILIKMYRRERGRVQTIGLGDSLNDWPLLKNVDRPVLIRHPDGSYDRRIKIPALIKTRLAGTAGWNQAVQALLREMTTNGRTKG